MTKELRYNGLINGLMYNILLMTTGSDDQEGWYIGGKHDGRMWKWADGTPMDYKNFAEGYSMRGGMKVEIHVHLSFQT